jgi:hypothetical protein
MEQEIEIEVLVAGPQHEVYVDTILDTIAEAAKVRGTGIAKRTHEYLTKKMLEVKAVIALTKDGRFAGFSYIETWENQQYVTTSDIILGGHKVGEVVDVQLVHTTRNQSVVLTLDGYDMVGVVGSTELTQGTVQDFC